MRTACSPSATSSGSSGGVGQRDAALARRFGRELDDAGVTHVLPMLAVLSLWALAARAHMKRPARCLVTFQGYELYVKYAQALGLDEVLYQRLRAAVAESDWPAIAVSADYRKRVYEDIGVPTERMVTIPPGVPIHAPGSSGYLSRPAAQERLASIIRSYRPGVPLVTFVGRRDVEKGIDLLLYAAAQLRQAGVDLQLAIAGPTLFGSHYAAVCRQLAQDLRLRVWWYKYVNQDIRAALLAGSTVVVYPSIHREPFGMVAAEALACGTPVVVPAYGGVADVVEAGGACGGLRFDVWDSGDLARQLQRLLTDRALWQRLADAGPQVAAQFSIEKLADRVLQHVGINR